MINVCSGRLDSLYYAAKLHIFHQTAKKKQKKPSLTNGIALAGPCELIAGESGSPLLRGFSPPALPHPWSAYSFFPSLFCCFSFYSYFCSVIKDIWLMTSFALNNLWTYLQGLSLSQHDREWLANKLIMPKEKTATLSAEERKAEFLKLAGIWSETEEGEEYYQMMKHRNEGRPLNREINLDD
jgi:hypothetical protein